MRWWGRREAREDREPFIQHLREEIAFWREQFVHERQRAEYAVDRLLAQQGHGPVTVPTPSEQRDREAHLLERLAQTAEFANAGE
jgi:hypothetical protein